MSDMKVSEMASRGGKAKYEKYGRDHYVAMGKKGGTPKAAKDDPDYYKKLSLAGVEARKKKRLAQNT